MVDWWGKKKIDLVQNTCGDVVTTGRDVRRRQLAQLHDGDRRGVVFVEDAPARHRRRQRRRQRVDRPLGDADAEGKIQRLQVLQRVQRGQVFRAKVVV